MCVKCKYVIDIESFIFLMPVKETDVYSEKCDFGVRKNIFIYHECIFPKFDSHGMLLF